MNENFTELPEHYSLFITNLIGKLLEKNPDDRPNINQILDLPEIAEKVKFYNHIIFNNYKVSDLKLKQEVAYRNTILPTFNKEKSVFNLFAIDDTEENKKLELKKGGFGDKSNQNLKFELKDKQENSEKNKKFTNNQDKNHKVSQINEIQSTQSMISPKV